MVSLVISKDSQCHDTHWRAYAGRPGPSPIFHMNREMYLSEITILMPTETTNSFLCTRTVGTFAATILLATAIQKCNAFTPHFQG